MCPRPQTLEVSAVSSVKERSVPAFASVSLQAGFAKQYYLHSRQLALCLHRRCL